MLDAYHILFLRLPVVRFWDAGALDTHDDCCCDLSSFHNLMMATLDILRHTGAHGMMKRVSRYSSL
jgi:hypothetical protein